MKINNFENFINEMASYNETMNILDLIYVLENANTDSFIIGRHEEGSNKDNNGENLYIIDKFIEIPSEGMVMDNINYMTKFSGRKYNFYTYEIENNKDRLFGITFRPEIKEEDADKVNLPSYKTIGDHIKELKKIPNPEKCLFFMRSFPEGYNNVGATYETCFEAPRALGNYNIKTYPLCKNKELVSGNITEAYSFMGEGSEGKYHYRKK